MSPANISEKLKELPHMTEEHLAVLEKHGLTTPDKLLAVMKDEAKWKEIHPELKGVGPKTVEKWRELLEPAETKAEKAAPVQAKKATRQVKKPAEAKPTEKAKEEKPEAKKVEKAESAKEKAAEGEKKAPKKEEAEEKGVEIVEEGGYTPNKKPKLPPEIVSALKKRKIIADNRPDFYRQEYGRFPRLRTGWRKPRGIHSKTRMNMRYRRPMVNKGYAGPSLTKNLHPSGFKEVYIRNVADLSKISDADREAARIAHSVGQRKREQIIKRADELGIRVLNRS